MRYIKEIFFFFLFIVGFTVSAQTPLEEADSLYNHYRFEEALQVYEKYEARLKKQKKTAEIEALRPLVEKTKRASRLLSRCEDIQIIDSVILDKQHFLDAYLITSEAGYLEVNQNQLYYINQLRDKRYFARKAEGGKYRLFSEIKLQDEWSDRRELALPSDSLGDDNYPFVLSDGVTLYYASTGHGSLGGYDLFISRYNYNGDAYFAPSQLGMPFNSPYNDYLLVIDELNEIGYFATDRYQDEGKVIVYTYVPNDTVESLELDDEELLRNRAMISSIRDSWKPGKDYVLHKQMVKDFIEKEQEKARRDFVFVINDNIVYYSLDDFESQTARQSFIQWQELGKQIQTLEEDLDNQRKEYAGSGVQKRGSMRESILRNENRLYGLYNRYNRLMVDTRNLEIRQLRTNN